MDIFVILSVVSWYIALNLMMFIDNNKMSRLSMSVSHALCAVICYCFKIPGMTLFYISTGYYIIDGIYELLNLISLYNVGLLIHHIITILGLRYLSDSIFSEYVYYAFFLSELSNFPMYLVHYLKINGYNNKNVLKILIGVEAIVFIVLRLIFGTHVTYKLNMLTNVPIILRVGSCAILIISVLWTKKLIMQVLYD